MTSRMNSYPIGAEEIKITNTSKNSDEFYMYKIKEILQKSENTRDSLEKQKSVSRKKEAFNEIVKSIKKTKNEQSSSKNNRRSEIKKFENLNLDGFSIALSSIIKFI